LQREQGPIGKGFDDAAGADASSQVGGVRHLAGGIDDDEEVIVPTRHHQVVEDAAPVVGEQRIALLAQRQADDIDRNKSFERGRGFGTGQAQLAHVRHVEQHGRFAAPPVLGEDPLRKRHRHVVAGERHHLRAEFEVQGMQRRLRQRRGRDGDGHETAPEQVAHPRG